MKKILSIILSIILIMTFAITSIGFTSIAVKSIKLSVSNITLQVGKTYILKVTITPANATDKKLTYSSGNKNIASVDKNGKIKGIKAGKAVITVTSSSNEKAVAKCNVTVSKQKPMEKMTVRIFIPNGWCPDVESDVTKMLEKKYNFDIQYIGTEVGQEGTKINLFVSSNNVPEIISVLWSEVLKKNGLASFSIEDVAKNMPYTYKFVNELIAKNGYDQKNIWNRYYVNGKLNQIPQVWVDGGNPRPLIWRKDLLDEFGLAVPTTISEMAQAFAAYKKKFPNQYPIAGGGKDVLWQAFTEVFNSSGVCFFSWDLKDGKIVPGWTQPEGKEVLGILADWVKKGYISKSFVTMSDADKANEWTSGKSMVRNWQTFQIVDPPYADGSQFKIITDVVPTAKFVLGPMPVLHEGVKPVNYVWDSFHGGSQGFGKQLQNEPEKLARLMKFLDDCYGDPEISSLTTWGIEDKHWKYTDDTKTRREFLPGFKTSDEQKTANLLVMSGVLVEYPSIFYKYSTDPKVVELANQAYSEGGLLGPDKLRRNSEKVKEALKGLNGEDLNKLYGSDLMKKRDIMITSIITGQKPLSEYDAWLDYWNKNGGAQLEEAANRLNLKYWK